MEFKDKTCDRRLLVQQLFLRHERSLRAFVFGLSRDFQVTDDVVQETFLTVSAKADDFTPGTNFAAWACTIARLKVLESRRSTRRFSDGTVEVLAASYTPAPLEDDRLQAVLECLQKLPARAREIMHMRYLAEQAPADIARQLHRSPNGVRVALAKARELLRNCVAHRLGGSMQVDGGAG